MSLFFVVLVVSILALIAWVVLRAVPADDDIAWLAGPRFTDPSGDGNADAIDVCRRYLLRHRRHRVIGGLYGVIFAAIVGVRWFSSISIGIGQGSPLADLLFCGLTGVIVGALSAETFRLGSSSGQPRAASLSPRPPTVGAERVVAARVVAAVALGAGIGAVLLGHGALAFATSLILVVPFALAEVVRHVIESRSRPVMSDSAQLLDERLRAFAASSVSFLHVAIAALMLGWTAAKVDGLTGVAAFVRFVVVIACLVAGVLMLRRAAPHRPRGWSPTGREGGSVDGRDLDVDAEFDRSPVA